jgi:hypothetical protein
MQHPTPLHSVVLLCTIIAVAGAPQTRAEEPYVNSAAIKARFDSLTPEDIEMLRSKKVLLASRSFGVNLQKGFAHLAKARPDFKYPGSYSRHDIFKAGGDVSVVPGDAFQKANFVHVLATHWPLHQRLDETFSLLEKDPHAFGDDIDAVVVFYHTAQPDLFPKYREALQKWRQRFPKLKIIAVTAGFMGPKHAESNEKAHAFSEMVRSEIKGQFPLYDLGAILSDDFRAGHVYCPEYSSDPADVHPNLPAGEEMMAKGFLLLLKEAFTSKPS